MTGKPLSAGAHGTTVSVLCPARWTTATSIAVSPLDALGCRALCGRESGHICEQCRSWPNTLWLGFQSAAGKKKEFDSELITSQASEGSGH